MQENALKQEFELVDVKAGVKSLHSLEFGQTFHPVTGPMVEAKVLHVVQQRLVERAAVADTNFVIWDVGFGAAANALAAVDALLESGGTASIHSFDKTTAPIEFALEHAGEMDYIATHHVALSELLANRSVTIAHGNTRIEWQLHIGDFREVIKDDGKAAAPHAIFYDPYSPSANPEMWSLEHFSSLRKKLCDDAPCLWTNYTRSTAVRVTLLLAGFFVGEGCAIGEKEVTTIASNDLNLIERPLDDRWLERVARSVNSAPLRGDIFKQEPIAVDDLVRIKVHPQFTTPRTNPAPSSAA